MLSSVISEFRRHELLMAASAIAFRILVVTIPASLFLIGVLGAFQLEDLWRNEAAPELRQNVSQPVYELVNDVVIRVFEGQQPFWITIGALLAVVGMASVVDAVTRTLNRIHGAEESRTFVERAANAVAIGALTGVLVLAAIAVVRLGPFAFTALIGDGVLVDVASFVVRWALAAGLLVLVVVLMVRVAPDMERPLGRVTRGAAITVGGWIVATLLFSLYLETLASYDSVFGHLATLYVFVQYVALSAIVYVAGLVIDAIAVRER